MAISYRILGSVDSVAQVSPCCTTAAVTVTHGAWIPAIDAHPGLPRPEKPSLRHTEADSVGEESALRRTLIGMVAWTFRVDAEHPRWAFAAPAHDLDLGPTTVGARLAVGG